MLKQERQERERAEAELTLARTRSAEKKAQLAAAKQRLVELQASPMPQSATTDAVALDAAKEEREALLLLKQEKEQREHAEAELAMARTRSAQKKQELAAAKARLAELQGAASADTATASANPLLQLKRDAMRAEAEASSAAAATPQAAQPDQLRADLDAAKEERDALLVLKQEKEARERAEAELALARTRSAEKKAQLAAAKDRLAELESSSTPAVASGPEETDSSRAELDAAKEERDALLLLKREKEEREQAEAELAMARTRSAQKKEQLAAAKARLAELQGSPASAPAPAAAPAPAGSTGMLYQVVKAVAVRDGLANTAQDFKVGQLAPGEVVEALELGTTQDGSLRIRIDCSDRDSPVTGWVNLTTKLGSSLLRPLADGAEATAFDSALDAAERNLEDLDASVTERDALLSLKLRQQQPQDEVAIRELQREKSERERAEMELALARTRSAEKKAELAAAKARLAQLQSAAAAASHPVATEAGTVADDMDPLRELKQAASAQSSGGDGDQQRLAALKGERDKLLAMQRAQKEQSDPLAAPRTALLRQARDEHAKELDRIRSSSRGALPAAPPDDADPETDALLAQYEAELYTEEGTRVAQRPLLIEVTESFFFCAGEEGEELEAATLQRTGSAQLLAEAEALIATSSRQILELEHARQRSLPDESWAEARRGAEPPAAVVRRVNSPDAARPTAHPTSAPSQEPLMQVSRVVLTRPAHEAGPRPGTAALAAFGVQ